MRVTMPMGSGFAGGLAASMGPVFKTLAQSGALKQQAEAEGALKGAQTAYANEQTRELGMRNDFQANPDRLLSDPMIAALAESNPNLYRATALAIKLGLPMGVKDLAGQASQFQSMDLTGQGVNYGNAGDLSNQNRLISAASGKTYEPFKAVGDTGYSLNAATGAIGQANPALAAIFGDKAAAEVAQKQATQANSNIKYDQNRGVIVDVQRGTASPVTTQDGKPLPYQDKPLPTTSLKMQQESLDLIGSLSGLNKDLGAFEQQIKDGTLNLGPLSNLWNKAMNGIGLSSDESRALQSFQATLEKLRNDSLRLNKGVQTEGDAERAWNEMVANINDPKVVSQRLQEIQAINERAANLHMQMNDDMRANYGLQPMEYQPYLNVGSAIKSAQPIQSPAARTAVSKAVYNGRVILKYSDGSVEYE